MERKDHFPLFCQIRGKKALVVGGGNIAARRCAALSRFSFSLLVVSPTVHPAIAALEEQGLLRTERRPFRPGDEQDAFLVVAATNSRETNHLVGQLSQTAGSFVSVADCREECTFYFPALIETETLTVGVTGNGRDHAAVAQCAEQIRRLLK